MAKKPDSNSIEISKKEDVKKQISLAAKLENFDLMELIGQGGFGHVYKARDKRLERIVALKFFSKRQETDEFNLKKEAEAASRLTHENIAQVYSWHDSNDLVFYSMEFVEGVSLDEYLRMNSSIEDFEKLRIIAEASLGLHAAHQQGILHRDIKPQNILVSKHGKVKIVDFGLSRMIQEVSAKSRSRMITGTLGYMSPEQAHGKTTTASSDIYSLAATAYYILAGKHPFSKAGTETKQLLKANQSGSFTPLLEETQSLPPTVYKWMTRALHPVPERRFQTAEEFQQAVQESMFAAKGGTLQDTVSNVESKTIGIFAGGLVVGLAIGLLLGFILFRS